MTTPLIIETAINGATPKTRNPHVPVSPAEIERDIFECVEAGASVIHSHIEDFSLNGEAAAKRYREGWVAAAQRWPHLVLSPTATGGPTIEQRWSHNEHLADWGLSAMAWLDPGSMNLCSTGDGGLPGSFRPVYQNSFDEIDYSVRQMEKYRLGASIAIYEPGWVRLVLAYWRNGRRPQGAFARFYFGGAYNPWDGVKGGISFGLPPTKKALEAYVEMLDGTDLPWAVAVLGGDVTASGLTRLAIERGGHVRVGLEDHAGERTPTNRQLVSEVVAIARELGRPIADCETARKILNLPRTRITAF